MRIDPPVNRIHEYPVKPLLSAVENAGKTPREFPQKGETPYQGTNTKTNLGGRLDVTG